MRSCSLVVCALLAAACSGGSGTGDDGGDDTMSPDAATTQPLTIDKAQCAPFAQSFADAAAACGTPLPAGGQAMVQSWCEHGTSDAELCGGRPADGLDCFATADDDDWVCGAGGPYPSCGGDLDAALGAFCLMALGNPACASIACEYDVDCGTGNSCNSVTGRCFRDTAYCVGLPCAYDVDCPGGATCNAAEGACVGG